MALRWVDVPRRYPGKCAVTGHSKAADGPYLEGPEVSYQRAGGLLGIREVRGPVYLSRGALEMALRRKGSPLVALAREQHRAMIESERNARALEVEARAEADDLRTRLAELESENAELLARVDAAEDLAEQVASRLAAA